MYACRTKVYIFLYKSVCIFVQACTFVCEFGLWKHLQESMEGEDEGGIKEEIKEMKEEMK